MIEAIQQPNPAVEREVMDFLSALPPEAGVAGEHDPRWLSILNQALGHQPLMLLARDAGGKLVGYLPLALVSSRLFGRFLVSLPYLNRGGLVCMDPAVTAELIDHACQCADRFDVDYLELRQGQPIEHARLTGKREDKVRMVLDLPADAEQLWKDLDPKVRNQIRKGDKHELTIRWGGLELLGDFYQVFAVNMRDLGTPVYSRQLFARIISQLSGGAELGVVDCQGRAVAGAMLIHTPGRQSHGADHRGGDALVLPGPGSTQVPSASCLRAFNHTNANMWMYHHLLQRAMERGSRQFDFGRSSEGSGTYRFKKQWGALPVPTVWQYYQRRGDITRMRPDNPRHQRHIAIWQRLPVWLTRCVGPCIVRGIP